MKMSIRIALISLLAFSLLYAQQSGKQFRRYNIINKNQVRTVFSNGGVIGHPVGFGPRGAWLNDNNGYLGDVSPFVGAEIPYRLSADSTLHVPSVTYCLADRRPNAQDIDNQTGEFWGFEPKSGFFNESKDGPAVAIFTDPTTWPTLWADRLNDATDPGWQGQWNGFFGKGITNATEETYFAMDDNRDEEFNFASNNANNISFKPDSTNLSRNGMAMEMKVRALQWKQFLAQDVIFWLYEIRNQGTTTYNKTTFGMLVGTYVGVTSTESNNEWDDDWSFFDAELDLTYTGDYPDNNARNPRWVGPVGLVGYAFLESPGNPFDGIDNDNDADQNDTFTNAPVFEETDFDSITVQNGDQLVLINNNFERNIFTVNGQTTVTSMGKSFNIVPGVTKLVEGNVLEDSRGRQFVNPNAIDGIDNDLDGIIDENYFIHYRQRREDTETGTILFDIVRPLRYVDYKTGLGLDDLMLDESRVDGIDNNGDWDPEFDDVGLDGVAETGDQGEGDGEASSGAATGLPGEPHIDVTDVLESDQIGLTSFDYFLNGDADITDILVNDEKWWNRVSPGNFDVPASIVNNVPQQGEDGDFFYASGYFPLRAKQTERFSIALVYGGGRGGRNSDLADLQKNLITVQKIYDSNYQFPKEPDTPTLTAEVGDGQVTLYWDTKAEKSFDPVLREFDFEGYRLYKSTDPDFKDSFTITNAKGDVELYRPIEQWDLANGIRGIFQGSAELAAATDGLLWPLGDDTGLRHFYVDNEVENGRVYYYALTAYDHGDPEDDIFPAESPFLVTVLNTGEVITGQNTVRVIPGTNVAGYTPPEGSGQLNHIEGYGTGNVRYNVIDEKALKGHTYQVEFFDTSNDGIDNDGDWNPATDDLNNNLRPDSDEPNMDINDPEEFWPFTTSYSVRDLFDYSQEFRVESRRAFKQLKHVNLDTATVVVKDASGNSMPDDSFFLDWRNGKIRPDTLSANPLQVGQIYTINYQYFPVFRSSKIDTLQTDEFKGVIFDTEIFDGLQLSLRNFKKIELIDSSSGWSGDRQYEFQLSRVDIPSVNLFGKRVPYDYKIEFFDTAVDTSLALFGLPASPVNFKITNTARNSEVDFLFFSSITTPNPNGYFELYKLDEVYFYEKGAGDQIYYTWYFQALDSLTNIPSGTTLTLNNTKSFTQNDKFVFTSQQPAIDRQVAKSDMDKIKVVPNPYVVAHANEAPLPPTVTSGRGERKVTFTNLPQGSKIRIFTVRGEHVVTIDGDTEGFNGTADWNLRTKENLDISYGVYFYVVESPVGKKKGKLAIIK